MKTRHHELEHTEPTAHATKSVLTGLLVGGAIGAVTALLFAPRSGDETRAEIRNRAVELRDRTSETVKDTVAQARSKADELKESVSERAEELKQRGKHAVSKQLDRVSQAAEDGTKKVEEY
jgi:gas vesicle protein